MSSEFALSSKKRKHDKETNHKELKRLEKLVFGDPSHIFEEDTLPVKKGKVSDLNATAEDLDDVTDTEDDDNLKPVWEDDDNLKPVWEDDDDLNTCIKSAHKLQGRPNDKHPGKPTDSYDSLLKKRFENIVGDPKWAEIKSKNSKGTDNDFDDESNILQRCGNFLKKSKTLSSGTLNFSILKELNAETRSEGKIIKAIEFHPTSSIALVAGLSGTASLFEVNGKTNPKIQTVKFPKFDIHCAKFTHGGDQFIVGSKRHRHFYSYDMVAGRFVLVPTHHASGMTNMEDFQVSPDGSVLAVSGKFGNIFLISVKTKELIGSLKMNGEVSSISFNSDSSRLYSHGDDGHVYVWDMNRRMCIHKFTDEGCLKGTSISVSPDDQLLACGSSSGVVNLYKTSSILNNDYPTPLKALLNLTTAATSLKFNHSSELLAMASVKKDRAIRLMHYPSLSVYKNFPNPNKMTGLINCLSFSPNSGYLAVGSNSSKALLFSVSLVQHMCHIAVKIFGAV